MTSNSAVLLRHNDVSVYAPKWKILRPPSVYLLCSFPQLPYQMTLKVAFYVGETINAYRNLVERYEEKTQANRVRRGDDIIKMYLKNYNGRVVAAAPPEDEGDYAENSSCKELERIFGPFPKYSINILMGECSAHSGREYIFEVTVSGRNLT